MKELLNKLLDKPVIAIDFDGTITKRDNRIWNNNRYTNDVYEENIDVTSWVRRNRSKFYLILWTCRYGKALKDAIKYCTSIDIKFDAVNKNLVPYKTSNKVLADYYIDDKNVLTEELLWDYLLC